MSCTGTSNCGCGCCAGTSVLTPQSRSNTSPGLAAVPYRAGTWASFKQTMLARLSSSSYPALAALKTRDDDDFSIALLDASCVVLDILTFYQERLANESYLRTAGQLRSLTELSRLIGYQPSPGVSASTYLAFTLKSAPGQPDDPNAPAITIPQGTQVQSVPAQGQTAQTFETSAAIQAKADWSALPVLATTLWKPAFGDQSVYLAGVATQLSPGDLILVVGDERLKSVASNHWDIRAITAVAPDTVNGRTYVTWSEGLGNATYGVGPAQQHAKFYAFRQRASLFGYNALSPLLMTNDAVTILANSPGNITSATAQNAGQGYKAGDQLSVTGGTGSNAVLSVAAVNAAGDVTALSVVNGGRGYANAQNITVTGGSGGGLTVNIAAYSSGLLNSAITDWNFVSPGAQLVDLDATYSKIVPGGWIALDMPDPNTGRTPPGYVTLYQVKSAAVLARSAYGQSGKISRLLTDSNFNLPSYYSATRQASVLAQAENLAIAEQPLNYPLYGTLLDLDTLRPDLVGLQVVALSGVSQKISVNAGVNNLQFVPDDPSGAGTPASANPGDVFTLIDPAPLPLQAGGAIPSWAGSTVSVLLRVQDASGRTGTLQTSVGAAVPLAQISLAPSSSSDPEIGEFALVSSLSTATDPYPHTQIQLQSALANCYNRGATTINANVGLATQGQSVTEIMGSGNGSTTDQDFTLKQSPLTYVQAPTPTGRQSTLDVQVNGMTWSPVPSLYNQSPTAQVYATLNQPDGTADVLFGDGVEGAVLPTGQNNIVGNYRIGLGSSGNVAANSLTTLIDRPLGVSGVTNPEAATGGQDPETVTTIRANAPLTALTLGRAVSIEDYANYAGAFAGIAKAYAIWIPSGPAQGVFLTVAAVGGVPLPPGNPTLANLVASLANYGNPLIPITVQSFLETLFGLSALIQYDPAYDQPTVQASVQQALSNTFSFAARTFGQGVSQDEVATVIQAVPGVVAVNVTELHTVATSTAGDLGNQKTGFSLAKFNRWRSLMLRDPLLRPVSNTVTRIYPYLPVASANAVPQPAEILVLDPDPSSVVLGVMP
jgi:Baseplate J-like protein